MTAAVDKVTKWIPGDALALYVTAVTAFTAGSNSQPSILLLIVFVLVSAVLVMLAGFAKSGSFVPADITPAVLAAFAFAIWSITVPLSGWQRIGWIADHQAGVAAGAALAAVFFTLIAEGVTKHFAKGA